MTAELYGVCNPGMDGYRLLKETAKMSYDLCSGCKIGGPTFKVIPGYIVQLEAEMAERDAEIESLKLQNSALLRRMDPQASLGLVDGGGGL